MDQTTLDSFQFNQEIQGLMAPAPESASLFTALLDLPPTQAVELLHENLTFLSNNASTRFSVFADSNLSSAVENMNPKCVKRKEREKKVKVSSKKSKNIAAGESCGGDGEKLPYVHVRVRRGQANDSHSLAERVRREKINARMKLLHELLPGCNKISGTALVLDKIINHVQSLQHEVEILSMKLAAVNPIIDFNLDSILATEGVSLTDSNFPATVALIVWPEIPQNEKRQQYQQSWQLDAFHQLLWDREENNPNFMTPENSYLSYDSSVNSGRSDLTNPSGLGGHRQALTYPV